MRLVEKFSMTTGQREMKNVTDHHSSKLIIVLMDYGFCVHDNPYDSIAFDVVWNRTTHTILKIGDDYPETSLLETFCDMEIDSWRERFMKVKTRKNEYNGRRALMKALAFKIAGFAGEPKQYNFPGGKNAEKYCSHQLNTFINMYDDIRESMCMDVDLDETISWYDICGIRRDGRHKATFPENVGDNMIQWLCAVIACRHQDNVGLREIWPSSNFSAENIKEMVEYFGRLVDTFYGKIDWLKFDSLRDNGTNWKLKCRLLANKVKERYGVGVSLGQVRMAWMIWEEESTETHSYPDARDVFQRLRHDKMALLEALQGEEKERILFLDNIDNLKDMVG
jgi:hypothetical protein